MAFDDASPARPLRAVSIIEAELREAIAENEKLSEAARVADRCELAARGKVRELQKEFDAAVAVFRAGTPGEPGWGQTMQGDL